MTLHQEDHNNIFTLSPTFGTNTSTGEELPVPTENKAHHNSNQMLADFLISQSGDLWERYVEHPFVVQLGKGTLAPEAFTHFLRQGYLYLLHYARVYALAAYKAKNFEEIAASMTVVQNCINEVKINVQLCESQGIKKEVLEATKASNAGIAYSRYILDVASAGDMLDLTVATTPCLLGYGEIGKRLLGKPANEVDCSDKNRYYSWAVAYAQDEYQTAVRTGRAALETLAKSASMSDARLQQLASIFRQATELEIAFWDSALASVEMAST